MHRIGKIAAALLLSWCPAAGALTVEFHGAVDGQGSFVVPPELAGVISIGDPVSGRFSYDPSTADSDPAPTLGLYVHRDPRFLLEVTLGGAHISTDPDDPELSIQILNDHPIGIAPNGIDRFGVISRSQTAISPSAVVPGQLHFFLSDLTETALDTDQIPSTLPDLGPLPPDRHALAQGQVATSTGAFPQVFVNFSITEWHVVPEPSGLALSSLALAPLLGSSTRAPRRSARCTAPGSGAARPR